MPRRAAAFSTSNRGQVCPGPRPPTSEFAGCFGDLGRFERRTLMNKSGLVLLCCVLLLVPSVLSAEADGPDHWQVTGVEQDDVLNIRDKPDPHAKKVGEIPPDGTCVKNLGCVGGLTFEEFTTLSDEEKKSIERERPRWCKVDYQGTVGWVSGRYLGEGFCEQPVGQSRN
jgi:hypothetical protein